MSLPRRGIAALVLAAGFLFLHLLGARDEVAVLSGTTSANGAEAALLGVFYVLAWFGAVVVAPILVLAAILDRILSWLIGQRRATTRSSVPAGRPDDPVPERDPGDPVT